MLAEHVPHLTGRSVLVIGQSFYQYCNTRRAVSFVEGGLEGAALASARGALDGAVHIVDRHVVALGRRHGVHKGQVGSRVAPAARADSRLDGPDVLTDHLAALLV